MREIHTTLVARDGHLLAATLYEPASRPFAAVQINSATAVPRRYYRDYAKFLSDRGFVVLTYDYRGIGDSKFRGAIAREDIRMLHWGTRDLPAALQYLHERHPRLPLLTVGHSAGGQMLGLAPNNHLVTAALGVAAQSGYWKHWPLKLRAKMLFMWNVMLPLMVAVYGKVPASVLGGDMPGGVAMEWSRWCRNPHYISDERGQAIREHFHAYTGPMRFYAVADDLEYGPEAAVRALAGFYRNAQAEVRVIEPRAYGMKSIGHFGFFRKSMTLKAWEETAAWLTAQVYPKLSAAA